MEYERLRAGVRALNARHRWATDDEFEALLPTIASREEMRHSTSSSLPQVRRLPPRSRRSLSASCCWTLLAGRQVSGSQARRSTLRRRRGSRGTPQHGAYARVMASAPDPPLGGSIRRQRELQKLSLRQLADLDGISLSQIERELREPSEKVLDAIARNLELSTRASTSRARAVAVRRRRRRGTGRGGGNSRRSQSDRTSAAGPPGGVRRLPRRGAAGVGDRSAEGRDAGRGSVAARALR
jgi:hypothetical protein